MRSFEHFILTKFNLGLYTEPVIDKTGKPLRADRWMEHRLQLFAKYCFPSITNQVNQEFTWLLLLDPKTPAKYLSTLQNYKKNYPRIRLCIGGWFDHHLKQLLKKDTAFLITTRLDNDDALHRKAINYIQKSFAEDKCQLVGFPLGYHLAGKQLYLNKSGSYSFLSLIEKARRINGELKIKTVRCPQHLQFYKSSPIKLLRPDTPMWLQVIHDRNLVNQAKGRPIALSKLNRLDFGLLGLQDFG